MKTMYETGQRHNLVDVCPLDTPYIVRFIISGICNFECYFCPVNKTDNFPKDLRTMLDITIFDKAIHELEMFPEQIGSIYFTGLGEPLLNKHLPYMISQVSQRDLCRSIKIITNASLLTPELSCQIVDAGLNLLRISVEAISDEGYRKISNPRIKFSYKDLLKNVEFFYKYSRGKNCRVESRVFTDTFNSVEDADRFKNDWGKISDVIEILHTEQIWSDFVYDTNDNSIPTTTFSILNESCDNICLCTEPHITMNILPNGKVTACCADWNNSLIIGDLRFQTLIDIWNSNEMYNFRLKMLQGRDKHPFCAQCKRKMDDIITRKDAEIIINKLLDMHFN